MHELAVAEGVLAVALDVSEDAPVRRVRLRVGSLQHVVADSLQFAFQLVSDGTAAAEAILEIKQVRARVRCKRCGATSRLGMALFQCPRCGAPDTDILSGDELVVDAIELESGWRYRPRGTRPPAERDHLMDHMMEDGPEALSVPW